ncbi:MAG: transglycosylase SLT domain-containing protein [Acidimicrobiales bacterium]|nr:transglycosylase SLT domain-containing protein [Acidimicrobiales bacterium]
MHFTAEANWLCAVMRRSVSCLVVLFLLPVATMVATVSVRTPEAGALGSARCRGLVPTIVGTGADDVLLGTSGPDVIIGFGGDDIIRGRGGDDVLCGGAGSDVIFGGPGDDWISGSAGYDQLKGGDGYDTLSDLSAACRGEVQIGCTAPPPPPPPEPAPPACAQAPDWVVDAIFASFADTPHVCHFADYIAWRESRWTPGIIGGPNPNGTYDYGLLQLNSQYIRTWAEWAGVDWNEWDDPMINAQIARALYDRAGQIWGDPLRPWSTR